MRAPVFRNLDTASTLLGLAFPSEVLVVLAAGWGALLLLPPGLAAIATIAFYAGVRITTHGRPPHHLQHALLREVRYARAAGRLSAQARHPAPRFPFAAHTFRKLARVPQRSLSASRRKNPRSGR